MGVKLRLVGAKGSGRVVRFLPPHPRPPPPPAAQQHHSDSDSHHWASKVADLLFLPTAVSGWPKTLVSCPVEPCASWPQSHAHICTPPPPSPPLHSDVCAAPHLFSTSRAQHTLALHYGGALSQRSAGRPGLTRWKRWQGKPGQVRARACQVGQGRADGIAAAAVAVASHGRATEERGHEGRRRQPDRHGQRLS